MRSLVQTSIALGSYLASITLLILFLHYQLPVWVILVLSLCTTRIVVQLFIIFHDCCHTSYFKSRRACSWLGHLLGTLTFTAYFDWQRTHAIHHRFMASLEERGGDIWLMTVPYLSGLRNLCLSLWHEQRCLLVSFGEAKAIIENSNLPSKDQGI